jgi:hypothetical protein
VSADLDAIAGAAIDCWTQACEAFAKLREAFTDADGPVVMDIADALLQLHELATDSAPAARRAEGV